MTHAKICGITRYEDAELAVELGAWALGFILWPHSKRAADPAAAAGIARALRRRTALVGVFVNATLDEIAHAADAMVLSHVQLHGDEGPAFCEAVGRRTGCKVIKAAPIASGADLQALNVFRHLDFHLLDTKSEGQRGGSGKTWDCSLAARRRSPIPMLLSGGLTPENVGEAITAVRPWGVDVASGVEASPGIKDPERLEAFLGAVAAADARREEAYA